MLSKSIGSGVMLAAIAVALGGAWWQTNATAEPEGIRTADVAAPVEAPAAAVEEAVEPVPEPVEEPVAEPPAESVAEEVPTAPRVIDSAGFPAVEGPIVTVNGRPLGSEAPQSEAKEAVASVPQAPRPVPRPEGLSLPRVEAGNYESITAAAHGAPAPPVPPAPVAAPPGGAYDPRQDGLVQVIGDNGQPIWIYEEQVPAYRGRNPGASAVPDNEFGFVYD